MMYFNWFYESLKEEIDGAMTYAKMAIELKAMNDKMSKTFYDMAVQEGEHAKHLFQMSLDYYDKITSVYNPSEIPTYLTDIKEKIVDCYTSKSVEMKLLFSMYKD